MDLLNEFYNHKKDCKIGLGHMVTCLTTASTYDPISGANYGRRSRTTYTNIMKGNLFLAGSLTMNNRLPYYNTVKNSR